MRKIRNENLRMGVMNERVFGRDMREESDYCILALMNIN
jgi:hypothetical protein